MTGGGGGGGDCAGERISYIHDLPEAILTNIFTLVTDVRSRNNMALTSRKWRSLERSTRTSLSLRGNVRDLLLLPTCFSSVSDLDLSHLSPWGHLLGHHRRHHHQTQNSEVFNNDYLLQTTQELIAQRLRQAFPNLTSLAVYARNSSTLRALAPHWPGLRHATLVRWHQRPPLDPPGADLEPLFASCPSLASLDLSQFYCWTEDIPAALLAYPSSAAGLLHIDLLSSAMTDGFGSSELVALSAACPILCSFKAPCAFNPMHFNFVGDDALLALAANCPKLAVLHLVDPAAAHPNSSDVQVASQDSSVSVSALQRLFVALPQLEDLALDLCQNVCDAGPALEVLGNRCPRMKMLKLGQFQGICRAAGLHLDGVALCGGLQSLCIRNSSDLTDSSLKMIARGCGRLAKFEIHGCGNVTEIGIKEMAGMLRSTLVEVKISACQQLDTAVLLRALAPVRDRIERLHIDCVWDAENGDDSLPNKKCRYSEQSASHRSNGSMDSFWNRSWDRLRYLSLWIPAGEVLSPLPDAGLDYCPVLEEICIKIEGDCRTCPWPTQHVFGLGCLVLYKKLSKMKLDCGEAIGYAFTTPMGHTDLSPWERFYLHGIGYLSGLYELDYWPPHDREVNQRSLSLPAAGLIQGCRNLRKLFIHGTAYEHFMRFFLSNKMPVLRDVQLREDYYPAPENDMSTEMRVDSCSRFEDALNSREIPD